VQLNVDAHGYLETDREDINLLLLVDALTTCQKELFLQPVHRASETQTDEVTERVAARGQPKALVPTLDER
jgi:hypothetical protein